ncbi:DNA recombination protein RmuC [Glaciecola sp. 1036]|uniref:DNA recombination protein RmuC n=1 Tax=Alteromonadaceae TaxID=72275 RepID=UPI003CFC6069
MDLFLNLPPVIQAVVASLAVLSLALLVFVFVQRNKLQQHLFAFNELEKKTQMLEYQLEQASNRIAEQQEHLKQQNSQFEQKLASLADKNQTLIDENTQNQRRIGELSEKVASISMLQSEKQHLQGKLQEQITANTKLTEQQAALQSAVEKEREHMAEKLQLLNEAEKRLGTEFENIANKIFEQKSEKFVKTSETGLNTLLSPLKNQIDEFKRQINEQYISEGKERASLKTEILGLKELNQKITEEAAALTNALKGDNKQQGNWGEIVLERILEESGLRNGHEYEMQKSTTNEEGKRYQPDVVVHLPNEKDIVIDSKVSLIAYERAINSTDKDVKERALKEHVASLKGHIKGLSKKDYQDLQELRTLDYVLMFIPVESAFIAAIESDPSLVKLAMDNQIMLVSPTNLLVALRTIHNIWQYEYQNQNAAKIAEKARKMYDKLANFVMDMEKIGKQLETTTKSYEAAMIKLSSGRGNLISQAESFKKLGVSTTKSIDSKYLVEDDESDDNLDEDQDDDANTDVEVDNDAVSDDSSEK